MAWTSPKTWVNGTVVTDTDLNTHIRDNLNYLKGGAGAMQIDSSLTALGTVASIADGSSGSFELTSYRNSPFLSRMLFYASRGSAASPSAVQAGDILGRVAALGRHGSGFGVESVAVKLLAAENFTSTNQGTNVTIETTPKGSTTAQERVRVLDNGSVGINRSSPSGIVHGYGSVGGFVFWDQDNVGGTAVTVLPAGSLNTCLHVLGVTRSSTGLTQFNGYLINKGSSNQIGTFNSGVDNVLMYANSDGSVTVARSSGSLTYRLSLLVIYQ